MKTFLHVAISGMVAFSSHVAILVCHQAELCYVYVFVFEFVSFLSKSDVIFRSHLPNMIDCTVTTTPLYCTQNPSQDKTQMP